VWDHLHSTLPNARAELGPKRNFGSLVTLPAGVIRTRRVSEGEAQLGHDQAAHGDGSCYSMIGTGSLKRQLPSQCLSCTGMVVDSFLGTISIPPDKKARLTTCMKEFFFPARSDPVRAGLFAWPRQELLGRAPLRPAVGRPLLFSDRQ
jgi:hypothetical protein